jgi:hypothetical protein
MNIVYSLFNMFCAIICHPKPLPPDYAATRKMCGSGLPVISDTGQQVYALSMVVTAAILCCP